MKFYVVNREPLSGLHLVLGVLVVTLSEFFMIEFLTAKFQSYARGREFLQFDFASNDERIPINLQKVLRRAEAQGKFLRWMSWYEEKVFGHIEIRGFLECEEAAKQDNGVKIIKQYLSKTQER